MHYTWFLAEVVSGTLKLMETEKFDSMRYCSWEELNVMRDELSANTKNLVSEYYAGKIEL